MKKLHIIITSFFLFIGIALQSQNVGVGTTTPDSSAILDVTSTDRGVLLPRLTTAQRVAVNNPAIGLLVFDTNTESFWFYETAGWLELRGGTDDKVSDADDDTKIEVEATPNNNQIRMSLEGAEFLRLRKGGAHARMLILNNDDNIFIGDQISDSTSGASFNIVLGQTAKKLSTGDSNAFIGRFSGENTSTGSFNSFYGEKSGQSNTTGSYNTYVGISAGNMNLTGANNVAIGRQAGHNNTGSAGVYIGNSAGYFETNGSRLYIDNSNTTDPLIYGEFDNDLVRINGNLEAADVDATGTITATSFVGDGANITNVPGDDLGDHSAIQNVKLNGNWISDDGGDEGIMVDTSGWTGVNQTTPLASLHVQGTGQFESGMEEVTTNENITGGVGAGNNWNVGGNTASKTITTPNQNGNYQVTLPFEAGNTIHFAKTSQSSSPGGYVRIKPSSSGTWTSWNLSAGNVSYVCPTTENYDLEFQYNSTCSPFMGSCLFNQQITVKVTRTHMVPVFSDEPIALFSGGGNVGIGTNTPSEKLTVAGMIETSSGGIKFPDGTIQTTLGISDNLGNHQAQQNLNLSGNWVSGDGDPEGIIVDSEGWAGVNTATPLVSLHVTGIGQDSIDPVGTTMAQSIEGGTSTGTDPWTINANQVSATITVFPQSGVYKKDLTFDSGDEVDFTIMLSASDPAGLVRIRHQGGSWTTYNFSSGNGTYTYSCPSTSTYNLEFVYNSSCPEIGGNCTINQSATISVERRTFTYTYVDKPIALFEGSGNVGIGTTMPGEKLSVGGIIESTTGGIKFPDGTIQTTSGMDTDDQAIDTLVLDGSTLEISLENDGQAPNTVDLSSLANTDDQVIDTLVLDGSALQVSLENDGQAASTVDLSSLANTDDQAIDTLVLDGSTLEISLENDDQAAITVDLSSLSPVGSITMYYGNTAPQNWLICDGSNFNAATYPELNALIGGNTLPDFSGRFAMGVGNSGTAGSTTHNFATNGGEEKHTLSTGEMPSHNHNVTITFREGSENGSSNNYSDLGGGSTSSRTYTSQSKGGGAAHNNLPPYLTVNYIIKAK